MISFEKHPNDITVYRVPVSEFFNLFKSEYDENLREREAEHIAQKFFGSRVKVVSVSKLIPFFVQHQLQLSDSLASKKNKVGKLAYVVFRDSKSYFSDFDNTINMESLNIGGFYDYSNSIILLTLFLRDITINKNNYKERITVNTASNVYKVLIHELTHYTYSKSEGFRNEVKGYVHLFYLDFFNLIFKNDFIYLDKIKPLKESLIKAESDKNFSEVNKILDKLIKTLKENKVAAKDRILYEDTIRAYEFIKNPQGMKLFSSIFFQKSMKKIYETRGVYDYPSGGVTIHGQELIYPSEILCVTADKLLISQTGRKYAALMLRYL